MINKSKVAITILFSFIMLLIIEVIYLKNTNSMSEEALSKKLDFISISGLPDLAISTEANYVRHRSISDMFSIYKDDGVLREYFPSTYVISHSHIQKEVK